MDTGASSTWQESFPPIGAISDFISPWIPPSQDQGWPLGIGDSIPDRELASLESKCSWVFYSRVGSRASPDSAFFSLAHIWSLLLLCQPKYLYHFSVDSIPSSPRPPSFSFSEKKGVVANLFLQFFFAYDALFGLLTHGLFAGSLWGVGMSGLFSHLADQQTEAAWSLGGEPNPSAFQGAAGHIQDWNGRKVGTDSNRWTHNTAKA